MSIIEPNQPATSHLGALEREVAMLRAENARLRAARLFLDLSQEQALDVAEDGTILYANGATLAAMGRRADEVVGQPVWSLSAFVAGPEAWRGHLELLRSGQQARFESSWRHEDGRRVPVEVSASLVEDEGVAHVCVWLRDVSERKAAESAVWSSEQRYRALIEHAPEAIVVLDLEQQRFVEANEPAAQLFGIPREGLLTLGVREVSPATQPDGQPSDVAARSVIERALAGETPSFEWTHLGPNGRHVDCEVRLARLPDPRRLLVRGSLVDITGKKRLAAASLAVSRGTAAVTGTAFFHALAEQLGRALGTRYVLIGQLLPDERIRTLALYAGGALVPNIEYALDGTPCENVVAKDLCVYEHGVQQRFPRDLMLVDMEAESYVGLPVFSATGEPLGLVATLDDRPLVDRSSASALLAVYAARVGAELERLAAEGTLRELNAGLEARIAERTAELTKANAELEAFTYSVSHDLRAPLRAIHGFSRALEEDCGSQLDATAMGHLERIRAGSTRMAQLIDDLLELSRVSRHTLSRSRTDLSAAARRCVDQLAAASPGRVVEVHVVDGLVADCDPRLVDVVLTNLLGNAWKFTSKKPGAHIEVGRDGPSAFFVRDDGAGFDPAYGGKLFKPFQRLHHASEFPGTGIGLALVHRIIDRHGGTVWAEGREQGGATFHFTLGSAEG